MQPQSDTVVLVHGLWLHAVAMFAIKRGLERCGYRVVGYSYPTVRLGLSANAERLARFCAERGGGKLHLVAHSMGGIVAIKAAEALPAGRVGRIVTLGTPWQDCYAGRCVQRLPWGRAILGKSMCEWIGGARPADLGRYDIGVVAGTGRLGLGRIFAPRLARPNDGVVSVAETRIPGARDHVTLRVSHTLMLFSSEVVHQACTFLDHGRFDHARPAVVRLN